MTGKGLQLMLLSTLLIEFLSSALEVSEEVVELYPKKLTYFAYYMTIPKPTVSPDGNYVALVTSGWKTKLNVISVNDLKRGENFTVVDDNMYQHIFQWLISVPHTIYLKEKRKGVVWLVDASTKQKQLAYNGTDFTFLSQSHLHTMTIAVGVLNPNTSAQDVYHLDLTTGQMTLIYKNPRFEEFVFDMEMRPRLGTLYNDVTFSDELFQLYNNTNDTISRPWLQHYALVHPRPIYKFVDSNSNLFYVSRHMDNLARLIRQNLAEQNFSLVEPYQEDCQPKGFLFHPKSDDLVYYLTDCQMPKSYVSKEFQEDLKKCTKYFDMSTTRMKLESISIHFTKVVMALESPTETACTFLCDMEAPASHNPLTLINCMEGARHDIYDLQPVYHLSVAVEGGFNESCYYSLPLESDPYHTGVPNKPIPWVIEVHGGPYVTYDYGLDRNQKLYTTRGYACMMCNFRGSGGYGYAYDRSAGTGWDSTMRTDIVLPVKEILKRKWADPQRICLVGGSYGGYQVLLNAVREDRGLFACFIDFYGPSELASQLQLLGRPEGYYRRVYKARMGLDGTTAESNQTLWEQSPVRELDNIDKPILIMHGATDRSVQKYQSDIVVSGLRKRNKQHIYMVFPNEGHGLENLHNQVAYVSVVDQFLHKYLGGRMEPVDSESFISAKFHYSQLHFDDMYVTEFISNVTCDPPICD